MTVKDEIGEMLKSLNDVSTEPEPKIDEPPKEEIKEELNETERGDRDKPETTPDVSKGKGEDIVQTVSKDGSDTSSAVVDTVPVEPKVEEPKVPEPDERDKTIADLRSKLAEKEVPREPEKKEPPKPLDEQDFLGEIDLDELTRDPKEFNKVLNKIYQRAVMDTRSSVVETLPDIVKTNIQIMNELKATSETFYEENKDLKPFKKVVAVVFDELAASNPNKTYGDIIREVAPEVRKRLDLKKEVKEEKTTKVEPPKLPQKAGRVGRPDKPTLEPLQSEFEEMNKTLGR